MSTPSPFAPVQPSPIVRLVVGPLSRLLNPLVGVLAGLAGIVFSFYTAAGYSLSAVGVELDTIAAVAATGVDLISSGWITHSAPILDLGLDIAS